jgi:hypothetical protein
VSPRSVPIRVRSRPGDQQAAGYRQVPDEVIRIW